VAPVLQFKLGRQLKRKLPGSKEQFENSNDSVATKFHPLYLWLLSKVICKTVKSIKNPSHRSHRRVHHYSIKGRAIMVCIKSSKMIGVRALQWGLRVG
jgi:hypothetical protein